MTGLSLTLLLGAGVALPAPLAEYIRAAEQHSYNLAIARSEVAARRAEQQLALSALLPDLSASATYIRNQYEVRYLAPTPGQLPEEVVIAPRNQLNATVGIATPVFDLQTISRYRERGHAREASVSSLRASVRDLQLQVAQVYYQIVAAQGTVAAAERAVATAETNQAVAEAKLREGTGTRFLADVARVDTARARRTRAEAERTLALARRQLATLTGRPEPGELPEPPEPPEPLLPASSEDALVAQALERRPEVARARELVAQAEAERATAQAVLFPVVSANAQENYSNATGFLGRAFYWTAGGTLTWNVDPLGTWATVRLAGANVSAQSARLAQQMDVVRDEVHTALVDIRTERARLAAVRAELESAREALDLAQLRAREGVATPLEVSEAQSDLFSADASLAQVRADLSYSLLALRRAVGQRLVED